MLIFGDAYIADFVGVQYNYTPVPSPHHGCWLYVMVSYQAKTQN
jgi:hypothetical protein